MDSYGPQVNVSVGMPGTPGPNAGIWQGLTIKEILEKVDLSNIIMGDEKKEPKSPSEVNAIDPESAFLGPKLWSRSIPMPITQENDDFSVMNIDDFLSENGFELNDSPSPSIGKASPIASPISEYEMDTTDMTQDSEPPQKKQKTKRAAVEESEKVDSSDNSFLYVESKRARLEREKEEKKRQKALEIEFSAQELALATVPGMDFDPRERCFAPDELRPQPIIRKRKKAFVPTDQKDNRYWEKREKNNVAARRSREARRLKENQIALRTAYLERENSQLQAALDEAKAENLELVAEKEILLQKLKHYGVSSE